MLEATRGGAGRTSQSWNGCRMQSVYAGGAAEPAVLDLSLATATAGRDKPPNYHQTWCKLVFPNCTGHVHWTSISAQALGWGSFCILSFFLLPLLPSAT